MLNNSFILDKIKVNYSITEDTELEKRWNLPKAKLGDWRRGRKISHQLIELCVSNGLSLDELILGRQAGRPIYTADIVVLSPDEVKMRVIKKGNKKDEYIPLPLYSDPASLGQWGVITDHDIEGFALIHSSKVPRSANAACIKVSGNSMLPDIRSGDIVCIDCNQRDHKLLNKKLVAANITPGAAQPEITIKELRVRKGRFYFHAYNSAWEAEHGQIEIDIQEDVILGKVITLWRGF
jgi:SOS-response transcriptional repressor LexA